MLTLRTKLILVFGSCLCLMAPKCQIKRDEVLLPKTALNISRQVNSLYEFKEQFTVIPGKVTFIQFPYFGPFDFESLVCNGNKIPFFADEKRSRAFAYIAPSYFAVGEAFSCELHFGMNKTSHAESKVISIGQFKVGEFKYPEESLKVDKKKTSLSLEDAQRVENEKLVLDGIYQKSAEKPLIKEPFSSPLDSHITSIYGTKRVFNKTVDTQHLGTDFRAKIGAKVNATNSGVVVFTGDLFFGGNTVVVDHGLGIFTSYSHLSKIVVNVGQQVTKESMLGLSGMTGRVNGPHLHWGVKVHGSWVDGHSLIKASQDHFPVENIIGADAKTAK